MEVWVWPFSQYFFERVNSLESNIHHQGYLLSLFTESFYRFSLFLYRDSLENIDTVLFPTIAKNLTTTSPSLSMPQKQIQLTFQQSLEPIFFKNSCRPKTDSSGMLIIHEQNSRQSCRQVSCPEVKCILFG